jgi:hypothetical protein
MRAVDWLGWRIGATDAVAVLLVAAAVGHYVVGGSPATTSAFDRALPTAIALLAPLAVWLGRCHSSVLRANGPVTPQHVLGVLSTGAACGVAILLTLALGPLLTPTGWAQFIAELSSSHGIANSIGALLELVGVVPFYVVVGMAVASMIGFLNCAIVSWCTRRQPPTTAPTSS